MVGHRELIPMKKKVPRVKVIMIVHNHELKLASDILLLRFFLENEVQTRPDIILVDNGSTDRTLEIARMLKVELFKSKERKIKKDIVKKAMRIGEDKEINTLIILDVQGGNTADDAISLIARSIKEGERFASAYIKPVKDKVGIGCWAMDRGILDMMESGSGTDIQSKMLELATKEDLELWAISEEVSFQSKKTRKNFFKLFKGSPIDALSGLIKYHPLTFYSGIGLLVLSLAILSGFYTVDYFYRQNTLNYFPALTTVGLVMIGGFFMVAGLILNAFNVLVERLEAMSKWKD
jgi:glycosyltransferase involved in cell wall biosynthesis